MVIKCIFIALMSAIVTGCATSGLNTYRAWNEYQAFQEELEKPSAELDLSPYLSERLMSFVNQASSDQERRQFLTEVAYPLWIELEKEHYEKSADDGGVCLTVNGQASDGKPASVSIHYAVDGGRLKAEDIHYELMDTETQQPTRAWCPSEFSLDYPSAE